MLLLLAVSLAAVLFAVRSVETNSQPGQPITARVGIYVLSLGKLDTATGAFTVDFFLSVSCDRPCDQVELEFTNGRATFQEKQQDQPLAKIFRIQAALADNLDYEDFPFDAHRLSIVLEDKRLGSDQLVLVVDRERSGVDPRVILSGWDLGTNWDARVEQHYYPVFEKSFSQLVFHLPIRRSSESGVLKFILPSLIFVACGFAALFTVPALPVPRVTMSTASLLGSVVFHLNTTSSLPPLGYPTYADRFMLMNYLALFACVVSTIVLALAGEEHRQARVRVYFLTSVPSAWLLAQAINALLG